VANVICEVDEAGMVLGYCSGCCGENVYFSQNVTEYMSLHPGDDPEKPEYEHKFTEVENIGGLYCIGCGEELEWPPQICYCNNRQHQSAAEGGKD